MANVVKVIDKIYSFLESSKAKVNLIYGGAGSGKSYTLAQYILLDIVAKHPRKSILVSRKFNPSLKLSSIKLFKELLETSIPLPYRERKAEQSLIFPNGCEIHFRGLDDPEKVKSMEFNFIWLEEATEFTSDDFQHFRLRLRKATNDIPNRMFLTFNPIGKHSWIYKHFFEEKQPDAKILHTVYKDNPFLDKEYVKMLEDLVNVDRYYYEVYVLGKFAELINTIYDNWEVVKPTRLPKDYDEIIYGVDFGYNNPSAILEIGLKDDDIYVLKEFYRKGLTNNELIEALESFMYSKNAPVYADSAEPDRIKELEDRGFYVYPAKKSVKDGIDYVKRFKIYISNLCTNTIEEIEQYKWREDRQGNILEEPVKMNDHAMDALRYAVYTHGKTAGTLQSYKLDIL